MLLVLKTLGATWEGVCVPSRTEGRPWLAASKVHTYILYSHKGLGFANTWMSLEVGSSQGAST